MWPRRFLVFLSLVIAGLLCLVWTRPAHAEAEALAPSPSAASDARAWRPMRYASLEFNIVAPAAGRVGGQLQVGIVGPLTVVAGATHLHMKDSQHYDGSVSGNPTVDGWSFELGPRVYLGTRRSAEQLAAGKGRFDGWLGLSYVGQFLEEGAIMDRSSPWTGSSRDVQRNGAALDIGFQVTGGPFYLLTGIGISSMFSGSAKLTTNSQWGFDRVTDRGTTTPRFIFALGAGI